MKKEAKERLRQVEIRSQQKAKEIESLHNQKIGKWKDYIQSLEKNLVQERLKIRMMKEEAKKALGALQKDPNLKYLKQRLTRILNS